MYHRPHAPRVASRLTNSCSNERPVSRRRTSVIGRLNRLGPALPGFRYSTPLRISRRASGSGRRSQAAKPVLNRIEIQVTNLMKDVEMTFSPASTTSVRRRTRQRGSGRHCRAQRSKGRCADASRTPGVPTSPDVDDQLAALERLDGLGAQQSVRSEITRSGSSCASVVDYFAISRDAAPGVIMPLPTAPTTGRGAREASQDAQRLRRGL